MQAKPLQPTLAVERQPQQQYVDQERKQQCIRQSYAVPVHAEALARTFGVRRLRRLRGRGRRWIVRVTWESQACSGEIARASILTRVHAPRVDSQTSSEPVR